MNALTYSNSVLKEIEATLNRKARQQEMTHQEMKEMFKKALNAKRDYLSKVDDKKLEKEKMQQILSNVQQRMLEYKEKLAKNKETRHVGEVVGGKNKRVQKKYEDYTLSELKQKASKCNVKGYLSMNKSQLIKTLRK